MTSLFLPLLEWGGFPDWISRIHPTCFLLDSPYLVVGCKDGVIIKLCSEGIMFASGSGNALSHLDYYSLSPIDFLFKCSVESEHEREDAYLGIDRMGSLMLLDATDGRCLLFNALHLDSIYGAVQDESQRLWILQDDGILKVIQMDSLELLGTHKQVKHGTILALAALGQSVFIVYQQSPKSLFKVKLHWEETIVQQEEEMLELEEEAIGAEILAEGGIAYTTSSAVHLPNGETLCIEGNQKYLGGRVLGRLEDGKYCTPHFSFPKKALRRGLQFLCRQVSAFELIDLREDTKCIFKAQNEATTTTKTYFDHSTLTVYKGCSNGALKRLIAENAFSEADGVEFENALGCSSPIAAIYHSRRTGRIWTGHLNGDYCQWYPITRTCTGVIRAAHREAPVLFIESPDAWEPKVIVSVASDHSLSIANNNNAATLISDLPLETGRAQRLIWAPDSHLVIQEQDTFAKVWHVTPQGCTLREPLVTAEEIEAYKHNARHVDDLGHSTMGDSGVKGIIRAVNDSWSQLWGQLYMIDLRKLLSNDLQTSLGKEEDLKLSRAVFQVLKEAKFGVGSIGADHRISISKSKSPFTNSLRQLAESSLAVKLEEQRVFSKHSHCLLSFLCKFWQDPNVHIKSAVRTLLNDFLKGMTPEELERAVGYWSKLLPSGENGRTMHRAAIVLGLMITMDLVRDTVLIKHVSETLFSLLMAEEGRDMFRMAAMELLSSGLSKWQGYVHVGSLFRLVLSWAFALSPIRNVGVTDAETNYGLVADTFAQLLLWDAVHGGGRVISQWCKDLLHSPSLLDRIISMELLHRMLSKNQDNALLPFLGVIVEMIVKLLDPSHAEERERLRPTMIPLLHVLVTVFREACVFDQTTQYLAVIASPQTIVVYDLKSATVLKELAIHAPGHYAKIALKGASLGALIIYDEGSTCQLTVYTLGISSSFLLFFRSKPAAPLHSSKIDLLHKLDDCLLQFDATALQLCHGQETLIKL